MSEKPTGQRLADLEAAVATLQREGAVLVDGLNALVRRVLALETTTAPVYVVNGPGYALREFQREDGGRLVLPVLTDRAERAAHPGVPPMPCCGVVDEGAVRWNPWNQQVQCHHCGRIYEPSTDAERYAAAKAAKGRPCACGRASGHDGGC